MADAAVVKEASLPNEDQMLDAEAAVSRLAKPRIHSLCQILVQGVTSRDSALLESALSVQELPLITEALRRLPLGHVSGLLECILQRLQRRPHRTVLLLPWLRSLLLLHSSTLLAEPASREVVQRTERYIEARLRSQEQVQKAQGQLEVLLARFDEQKRNRAHAEGMLVDEEQLQILMTQPLATYDESEDDEDQEQDQELDQEDEDEDESAEETDDSEAGSGSGSGSEDD